MIHGADRARATQNAKRSSAADAEECERRPKDASVRCFTVGLIRINYIYVYMTLFIPIPSRLVTLHSADGDFT